MEDHGIFINPFQGPPKFWIVGIGINGIFLVYLLFVLALPIILILEIASIVIGAVVNHSPYSMNALNGVDYQSFYGCRMVYKDDASAQYDMFTDYDNMLQGVIRSIDGTRWDDTVLHVEISLPVKVSDQPYTIEERMNLYQQSYPEYYELLLSVIEVVHEHDRLDSDVNPTSMQEYIDNIAHFGLSESMVEPIATTIKTALYEKVVLDGDGTNSVTNEDVVLRIDELVDYYINAKVGQTEKLYVRDYLFTAEHPQLEYVWRENYVAMIFMPKTDVNFTSFLMYIENGSEDMSLYVANADHKVSFNEKLWMGTNKYVYSSGKLYNMTAEAYDNTGDIDLSEYSVSLRYLLKGNKDSSKYLQQDEETKVYTYNKSGVRIEFDSSEPFIFSEFDTKWD